MLCPYLHRRHTKVSWSLQLSVSNQQLSVSNHLSVGASEKRLNGIASHPHPYPQLPFLNESASGRPPPPQHLPMLPPMPFLMLFLMPSLMFSHPPLPPYTRNPQPSLSANNSFTSARAPSQTSQPHTPLSSLNSTNLWHSLTACASSPLHSFPSFTGPWGRWSC